MKIAYKKKRKICPELFNSYVHRNTDKCKSENRGGKRIKGEGMVDG